MKPWLIVPTVTGNPSAVGGDDGGEVSPVVTLPWSLTFDSDDPITGGTLPTEDDETWSYEDSPATTSVVSTPTFDGYAPTAICDKVLKQVRTDTGYGRVAYSPQAAGQHWDFTNGLRVCTLAAVEAGSSQHRNYGYMKKLSEGESNIHTAPVDYWITGQTSTKNSPDQVNYEYRIGAASVVDLIDWVSTFNAYSHAIWLATKWEIPAGGVGTARIIEQVYGDHAASSTKTAAMNASFGGTALDIIQWTYLTNSANKAGYLALFWVGSLTDDWPV